MAAMKANRNDNDDSPPKRPSSWSLAIAQLPGCPEEAKPKAPDFGAGTVREVSWDEDGIKEH
jgi:hypothetical protein